MPTLEQATDARLSEIRDMARSGVTELTGRARREYGTEGAFVGRVGGLKPLYPELFKVKDSPKTIAAAIDRGSGKVYRRVYETVRDAMAAEGFKPAAKRKWKPTIDPHEGKSYCKHCRIRHTKGQHRFHGEGAFHRTHLFSFGENPMTLKQARQEFAALMALSKRRELKPLERATLTRASQVIRYAKRSTAANPPMRAKAPARFRDYLEHIGYLPASLRPDLLDSLYQDAKLRRDYEKWARGSSLFEEKPTLFNARKRSTKRNPREGVIIYGQVIEIVCRRTSAHRCDAACKRVNHTYRHVFKSRPKIRGLADGSLLIK